MSKGKRKSQKKTDKSYSGINAHKREKKKLVPPLMAIPGITLQSWVNDRMPEMLWSALLISQLGREDALKKFREIADLIPNLPAERRIVQPTLSGLASLDPHLRQQFLSAICSDSKTRSALRPLLLFEKLPARAEWVNVIGQSAAIEDWKPVQLAVLKVLDHQSQEATDCRWLKVLFQVLSGELHLQTKEGTREILEYPDFGMPQKVRPSVRCSEGMIDQMSKLSSVWPQAFWDQCLKDTPCEAMHMMEAEWSPCVTTTPPRIREVREALARHEKSCLRTTDVDTRHDTAFGFGAYSLAILDELLSMSNSTSILGRIGLRTLLESYATISYLKMRDDVNLWMAYRQYGSGQAKLAFLNLDDPTGDVPSSVNIQVLSQLANEDRWLEFVPIDLGHWAALNLRKLSEDTGLRPDYDRLYPWTSAFTHGNWAAVRNSCFDLCINPVHRLHRRLRSDTAMLGDVIADACDLVDKTLDVIDSLYPGFTPRVTLPESKSASRPVATADVTQNKARAAPLSTVQRELFQILDQFFRRAVGCSAEDLAPLDSFGERIRTEAQKLSRRAPQAYLYVHEALGVFYERFASHVFSEAKNLSGLKLVLGGASHFGKSQFESVRKMVLYADSILIPDPILPWVESARSEERFRDVRLLEAAFILLHLKPLVDADLSTPPIVVVPSFEKSLEERDPVTQNRIGLLVTRILSHFLGRRFESIDELKEFAGTNEAEFMRAVDQRNLFIGPGGRVGQPLKEALELYVGNTKQWRSQSYQDAIKDLPNGLLVLMGIIERLTPQYHLLENATELSSCPFVTLQAPWHYYSLISEFFGAQLQAQGNLDVQTNGELDSIGELQQQWLGDIPIAILVELLLSQENEEFRVRLKELAPQLHEAPLTDLSRVTSQVCGGIASLLKNHHTQIQAFQEKYRSRYGDLRVQQYVTSGAVYLPTLAPTLQGPLKPMTGQPEHSEQSEPASSKGEPANSLLGVLGIADKCQII